MNSNTVSEVDKFYPFGPVYKNISCYSLLIEDSITERKVHIKCNMNFNGNQKIPFEYTIITIVSAIPKEVLQNLVFEHLEGFGFVRGENSSFNLV